MFAASRDTRMTNRVGALLAVAGNKLIERRPGPGGVHKTETTMILGVR